MEDLPDLYYVNGKREDGITVVQIYRPQISGCNRKLSSEELGELLVAIKDGTILKMAQKLGLRIFSVDYTRDGDGFTAQVRL